MGGTAIRLRHRSPTKSQTSSQKKVRHASPMRMVATERMSR